MRTAIVIDDDVAERLRERMRATHRGFKAVLNETLRLGLERGRQREAAPQFRVVPQALGELQPGVSLDNIAKALDRIEEPGYR